MKKNVSSKVVIVMCFFSIILGVVFSSLIYYDYSKVELINNEDYSFSSEVVFNLDSIENNKEDGFVTIKGWILKKNHNLETYQNYTVLKNIETNEMFKINTVLEKRPDVTESFNDSYNYDNSGFYSKVNKKYIKSKGEYEIYMLYLSDDNKILVPTNSYITIE